MLTQVTFADARGRIVQRIYSGHGHLFIVFRDGTYCHAESEEGYDDRSFGERPFAPGFEPVIAYKFGIINDTERDEFAAKEVAAERERELAELTRLKAKYEGAGPTP